MTTLKMQEPRLATWNSLGTPVDSASNLQEVLQISGLDFEVEKTPVLLPDGRTIPNRFATVRKDTGRVYDIVSDRYSVVQNSAAFEFVDSLSDEVEFVKAGETASGMSWIIARLPEVNILGDPFQPHIIFRNGFAGNTKITASICPLRVACQNQFNFAFANSNSTVKVLHVGNVEAKMEEAEAILRLQADFMRTIKQKAERMARVSLSDGEVDRYIQTMFPIEEDMNSFARFRIEESQAAFRKAYFEDDNYEFRNTVWGMINAYSDYITHKAPTGKSETRFENRFIQSTFRPIDMTPLQPILQVA